MSENIALPELRRKTLYRDADDEDFSILPAIPRDSATRADDSNSEDVKAKYQSDKLPTLSRHSTSVSNNTTSSVPSRRYGSSLNGNKPDRSLRRIRKVGFVLVRHLKFVGPGLVSSVAYFDP